MKHARSRSRTRYWVGLLIDMIVLWVSTLLEGELLSAGCLVKCVNEALSLVYAMSATKSNCALLLLLPLLPLLLLPLPLPLLLPLLLLFPHLLPLQL